MSVWAGVKDDSYTCASEALEHLAGIKVTPKQVRRLTNVAGEDAVAARDELVAEHFERPLEERLKPPPGAPQMDVCAVMMDGGRYQRRDQFAPRSDSPKYETLLKEFSKAERDANSHWREDRVGVLMALKSMEHAVDPYPEFPEWLVGASVVRELARLAARDENSAGKDQRNPESDAVDTEQKDSGSKVSERGWPDIAPEVLSREVVSSTRDAETFGRLLEYKAWTSGIHSAKRGAFVADGLNVNWTIHKRHFSHLTGVLDLMHALSYSWRSANALADPTAYVRYAKLIWGGRVGEVIKELSEHLERLGPPPADASASDPRKRLSEAVTYYSNHQHLMDYPKYRKLGLPITSSHIESEVKRMSRRVKGTEKFWTQECAEGILQLRADSICDSKPLDRFWKIRRASYTGSNRYRTGT